MYICICVYIHVFVDYSRPIFNKSLDGRPVLLLEASLFQNNQNYSKQKQ